MPDKYKCFSALAKSESKGQRFRIRIRTLAATAAVIAIHGGGIEAGTSEVAEAIAGDDLSFYTFEGLKSAGRLGLRQINGGLLVGGIHRIDFRPVNQTPIISRITPR